MSPDARSSQVAATTRADIARLTLRLRTALREADEAERAHPEVAGVSAELEARLSAMLDERRIAMDAELVAARGESARRIAEAQARADELLARRAAERAAIAAELEQRAAEQRAAQQRAAEQRAAEQRAAEAAAFDLRSSPVDAFDPWAPTVPPASGSHLGSSTSTSTSSAWAPFEAGEPATESPSSARRSTTGFPQVVGPVPPVISTNVVIDAEAFARVFAQVVGQMIDERIAPQHAVGLPYVQHVAPPPAPVPVKQSFWANARHLDVMLLGLTSVIVLVVLAAWLV